MVDNTIYLEADGVQYTGFTGVVIQTSLETLCDTFSFTAVSGNKINSVTGSTQANTDFPIKIGQTCKIIVNGENVINGYIEQINIDYTTSEHNITISGRDKTNDLVDSTLGENIDFNSGITLVDIAKKILKLLGITNINVINKYNLKPFKQNEIIKAQVGQTAFNFLEQYTKKRQVLASTDGDGNIEFVRTSNDIINTIITSSKDVASKAMVLSAQLTIDYSKRFGKYILNCQFNPSSDDINEFDLNVDKQTHIAAIYIDPEIRKTRIYNFQEDTSFDESLGKDRAIWEANYRQSKGWVYKCVVQGFTALDDGFIWRPNLLVTVIDDICGINSQLLISDVTYEQTLQGGSKTTLTLVDKDSYSITLRDEATFKRKRKNRKEANQFIL